MKNKWILILIITFALVLTYPFIFKNKNPKVIINGKTISIEIARTDTERAKGLSNRDYLAADSGMLFVFPKSDIYPFWMKDTKIPLDIVWINASTSLSTGKIVDIVTLTPQTSDSIPEYSPKEKANYVLELNANSGFKIGDEVDIKI
jgi:uncharacterized membrane protein (UPF0127 family)